ncbi:MAG: HAD family hydrolase, partial [Acidimicrobiales bacterium]
MAGVRLVATDLDGTFLGPGGTVTERAVAAVAAARAAGVDVIPVTARAPRSTRRIAATAGFGPLAVCANGAVVYDLAQESVLHHSPLAAEVAAGLVAAVRDAVPGVFFACETVDVLVPEHGLLDVEAARAWGLRVDHVPDVCPHLDQEVTKLICHHPDLAARELMDVVAGVCGAEGHVTSAGATWAEIGAPGVTKAYALDLVCDLLGLSVGEVVCVGDELNDLPMLAWAETAVAVANACPEVLALADRIVPPNSEDGVAQLLEELGDRAG